MKNQDNIQAVTIYEWNIDGKSEGEILNTLKEMGMANISCKCNDKIDQICVPLIVKGFTGQLKNWWDNVLTHQQKKEILEYKNEDGEEEPVNQLIDTINMHFIGNPRE